MSRCRLYDVPGSFLFISFFSVNILRGWRNAIENETFWKESGPSNPVFFCGFVGYSQKDWFKDYQLHGRPIIRYYDSISSTGGTFSCQPISSLVNTTGIVIPCFNEAHRLNTSAFLEFLERYPDTCFLFVNDGSTDDTRAVLDELSEKSERMEVLHLDQNSGKAEAVRQGMIQCLKQSCGFAGYWDADLSTPLAEIPRMLSVFQKKQEIRIVSGARVKLVGRKIERKPSRHYFGRIFATAVSVLVGIDLYDTQCGAKLFRLGPEMVGLFDQPFLTRWIFDVEIFVRYRQVGDLWSELVEMPLQEWRDVEGSKVRLRDFFRAPFELLRIRSAYKV